MPLDYGFPEEPDEEPHPDMQGMADWTNPDEPFDFLDPEPPPGAQVYDPTYATYPQLPPLDDFDVMDSTAHLQMTPRRRILYCDMDGVLCDFDSKVFEVCGATPRQFTPDELWSMLSAIDSGQATGFFAQLPWMPDGKKLWRAISPLQPVILSSLPYGAWAAPQKRLWCSRELGPHVRVITCQRTQKTDYCNPGDILIDDRDAICINWQSKGGIFIHHKSAVQTMGNLRKLGLLQLPHIKRSTARIQYLPTKPMVEEPDLITFEEENLVLPPVGESSDPTGIIPVGELHACPANARAIQTNYPTEVSEELSSTPVVTPAFQRNPTSTKFSTTANLPSSTQKHPTLPKVKGVVSLPRFQLNEEVKMVPSVLTAICQNFQFFPCLDLFASSAHHNFLFTLPRIQTMTRRSASMPSPTPGFPTSTSTQTRPGR